MDKDRQSTNSAVEAADDNEVKKPEHVIKAEVSIEVTGEDEPTKYDKRRDRWAVVAACSLVVLVLSTISFFIEMNGISFWLVVISVAVSGYSLAHVGHIDPDEPTGPTPWYYGGL